MAFTDENLKRLKELIPEDPLKKATLDWELKPSLPAWIEAIAKETGTSSAAFNPRLVQALGIAWEALGYYCNSKSKYGGSHSTMPAEHAIRQIEELGK